MRLNQRLKEAREQRGWSQARVAEQIGTDAGNVSRWERGYSLPSPYYREKLSALFDKSVQELGLLGDDNHKPDTTVATPVEQAIETPARGSRILAALSYGLFWWTGLLMLLFANRDRFVRFHSLQSLIFFGCVTLCNIALIGIISSIDTTPPGAQPFAPTGNNLNFIIVAIVLCILILNIGAAIAWILGIVMTLKGRYYKLPLAGNFCEKMLQSH